MEGDHIVPWSKGGKTIPDNLQMLCKRCNGLRGECFYAILLSMRKLRNFSTDRCYHLISRVANKAFYFTEEERGRFVERMRRAAYFTCI